MPNWRSEGYISASDAPRLMRGSGALDASSIFFEGGWLRGLPPFLLPPVSQLAPTKDLMEASTADFVEASSVHCP